MARLVLLRTSPRVAPGQLNAAAWRLLREASVVASEPDHPQLPALAAEGILVGVEQETTPAALAVRLRQLAGAGGTTVWLCGASGDPELVLELRTGASVEDGSVDVPGARILDLVAVMDRLRSPGGCPWDAAQTHTSLLPYLLEEAYETAEAVETGDRPALREELGDVLLQVAFHARLAEEHPTDPWDVDDVAADIVIKLISRHPHVFGAAGSAHSDADSAAAVEANWETIKRAQKGRTSAVDGVPLAQPALALAAKLMSRAEKAGLDVPLPAVEELNPQLRREGEPLNLQRRSEGEPLNLQRRSEGEIGDLLLAVVHLARCSGVDPEAALRLAARRYADAIRAAESSS